MESSDQRTVGTSLRSVAARPADTPLTVPARPPKTIAERGVFRRRKRAAIGVPTITRMALTRPVSDAQRHHVGAGTDGRPRDGAHDVGNGPGADRCHVDRVGVAEAPGDRGAHYKGQQRPEQQRDHLDEPRLASFGDLHFKGRGNNREIAQHGPAHQADASKQRSIGQAFVAPGPGAAPIGEDRSDHDGDGRSARARGQAARDLAGKQHDQPHDHEGADQAVLQGQLFRGFQAWRSFRLVEKRVVVAHRLGLRTGDRMLHAIDQRDHHRADGNGRQRRK